MAKTWLQGFILHKTVSEVHHWRFCMALRSGLRAVKFFHTKQGKPFVYGAAIVHVTLLLSKRERYKHKLLTHSWIKTVVQCLDQPREPSQTLHI